MDPSTERERTRRVENHAGVAIGRVDDQDRVLDFAGVRIGRALDDGVVEDFSGVRVGTVTRAASRRHAAVA